MTFPDFDVDHNLIKTPLLRLEDYIESRFPGVVWADDYAAGDSSTDDTSALNAAWDDTPNGGTLILNPNKTYLHTGLSWDHKMQVTVRGNETGYGYSDPGTMAALIYAGADAGTAISLANTYACKFKGFASYAGLSDGASVGAANNLDMTFSGGGFPGLSSQNTFEGLNLNSYNTRSDYIGLRIHNASNSNNEYHKIIRCAFLSHDSGNPLTNTGIGISIEHANAKQIIIENNLFSYLAKGAQGGGSWQAKNNSFGRCGVVWYFKGTVDAISIIGDDVEGGYQYIDGDADGAQAPVIFSAIRIGGMRSDLGAGMTQADAIIRIPGHEGGSFEFHGLIVDFDSGTGGAGGVYHPPYLIAAGLAGAPVVITSLNLPTSQGTTLSDIAPGLATLSSLTLDEPLPNLGGNALIAAGHSILTTNGSTRPGVLTSLNNPTQPRLTTASAQDTLMLGQEMEVTGVAPMQPITVEGVGVAGGSPVLRYFWMVAVDSNGKTTLRSNNANSGNITWNGTLSGSNYIKVRWVELRGAASYKLYEANPSAPNDQARLVASGLTGSTYNIVANPSGSYVDNTTLIPAPFNATSRLNAYAPFSLLRIAFANLSLFTPQAGDEVFVTDGTPNTSPLTGSGTGCVAVYQNGAWVGLGTAALSGYQPLDSDLTAIAALTTTSLGRSLLAVADAAALRAAAVLASTDPVQFAKLFLGGASSFGSALSGNAQLYHSTTHGLVMAGEGTTADILLCNKNGGDIFQVPTGTLNIVFSGNVGIAVTAFGTSAAKVLGIANGTAPSSSPANMVQVWCEGAELKVRDGGGTVTTLSPHAGDAPEWMYDSEDLQAPQISREASMFSGTIRFVNHTRAARLQQLLFDGKSMPANPQKRKTIHEETFAGYNNRRGLKRGDEGFLAVEDWDHNEQLNHQHVEGERLKWDQRVTAMGPGARFVDKKTKPVSYEKQPRPKWLRN